ncbi:Stage 0 sporulation protein J [Acidobacteriia bacterium SbA2]|nr:Stage 0 sporulation protein J [Acidobacteriia bacterium SbA2]
MSRKVLGRGLNALLQTVETATAGLEQVRLDLIDPNPFQPRRDFPEDTLAELADSIRSSGVIQPILVRRNAALPGRFQLVVGERRWRAARLAGLETVPAVVRELADQDALEFALAENLLRRDLNPIEVAHAYRALQDEFHLSHEQVAERLGVNRSSVTNMLRLLRLPQGVQDMITREEITYGHARALLALDSEAAQLQLAARIAQQGLSVREAESLAAPRQQKQREPPSEAKPPMDPNVRAAAQELERTLGTRVKIRGDGRRGAIEISYFSSEDLNRIYDLIVRQ